MLKMIALLTMILLWLACATGGGEIQTAAEVPAPPPEGSPVSGITVEAEGPEAIRLERRRCDPNTVAERKGRPHRPQVEAGVRRDLSGVNAPPGRDGQLYAGGGCE